MTKDIEFPKYKNNFKRYEEFKNIPADYIRELIHYEYTNHQIFEDTKLEENVILHKLFNKIRRERINRCKRYIMEINLSNNKSENEKKELIKQVNTEIKGLKRASKISQSQYENYKYDYENKKYRELKNVFESKDIEIESFYINGELEEYSKLKRKYAA